MQAQISLHNISKKYNKKTILDQIEHTFPAHQSTAFMGHNGCGKSTLLKIIAGLVQPSSGQVLSHRPLTFHYVPEKFMPVALTAETYLTRMGELDGLKKREVKDRIYELAQDFFVTEFLPVSMNHLSKGTLQKIGVIQALLTTPDVLLLDEPLSGQDIASQKVFIQKINDLKAQGVTLFLSSHEQELVENVSDQVYTIQNGKLIPFSFPGTTASAHFLDHYILILENKQNKSVPAAMEPYGTYYKLRVKGNESNQILKKLLPEGWQLWGMYREENH